MKVLILDRDGVINYDSDDYIKSAEEWKPIDGSLEAIATANKKGWTVVVATNQSGIGRGYYGEAVLEAMHAKMHGLLADHGGKVEHIAYCPHLPTDSCECRKPKPGLLIQLRNQLGLDKWPDDCWMVGDSLTDLQVGLSQSLPVALVRTGKGERTLNKLDMLDADVAVFDDLKSFVESVIH